MNPFYSQTRQTRIDELCLLRGQTIDIQSTLDDISDGCGGCERASFGTHDGKVGWVTVLADEGNRAYYALIVTDDYKPHGVVERATWGSMAMLADRSQDSPEAYAEFFTMVDEYESDEEL